MSLLLPEGITHLADVPYTFWDALRMALGFLRWEGLPNDERPPRRIWLDPEELSAWWSAVERNREARMRGEETEDAGDYKRNAAVHDLIR